MVLPSASDAAAWLLHTARAALDAGERLDLESILALRAIAPDAPLVSEAIERLDSPEPTTGDRDLASHARRMAVALRIGLDGRDEEFVRQLVSDIEADLLRAYKPGESLGSFDADVAMATLFMDIWEAGAQTPHQMMAEELTLVALRVYWGARVTASFGARAEAAHLLARLHRATAKPEYYDRAIVLLRELSDSYRQHGLEAARYVLALQTIG